MPPATLQPPSVFQSVSGAPNLNKPLCDLISQGLVAFPAAGWGAAEWQALVDLAQQEGVAALLYRRLQQVQDIPLAAMQALTQAYYQCLAHSTLLQSALAEILQAMHRAQVPLTLLKGADLAFRLYPDPGLRPMTDLDLLVAQGDLKRAMTVLDGLGYRLQKTTYHAVYHGGPGNQVVVELHWGLAISPARAGSVVLTWFDTQVENWNIQLGPAQVLKPEANLLYLAAHLTLQHGGETARLLWFYDLLLLLQRWGDAIDWLTLKQQAIAMGWQPALTTALLGVEQRFQPVLPASVREQISLLIPGDRPASQVPVDARTIRAMRSLSWRGRLLLAWNLLFPAPEYMRQRYQPVPRWLWPCYYPVRWLEMVREIFS